jgi:hypothetical protein
MELIVLTVLAVLLPICTITAFIIGFNVNATHKIFKPKQKKRKPTEDEIMLERIDKATVYEETV